MVAVANRRQRRRHVAGWATAVLTVSVALAYSPCVLSMAVSPPPADGRRSLRDHSLSSGQRSKIAGSVAKEERRARDRAVARSPRELCRRCSRPPTLCVCGALPDRPVQTSTRVLILQHPNERRKRHVSTVPLIRLVLERAEVKVGYTFEADALEAVREEMAAGRAPLLLYPGPDAISLDGADGEGSAAGSTLSDEGVGELSNVRCVGDERLLILFDGTWTEAKRMARDSPTLVDACRKVQFASDAVDCIYDAMRPEPEAHCLSTLEACARALELLEPGGGGGSGCASMAAEALHAVLHVHVDSHLKNTEANALPRFNGASLDSAEDKMRRIREIEQEMFGKDAPDDGSRLARVTLDDGSFIRPLNPADAVTVDSWWEYSSPKSLAMTRRCIALDGGLASLGIEGRDGDLRACIVRYEGGALGMLHVDEPSRRKGYGSALVNEASRALEEEGKERVAYIVDGNTASEAVFTSCGWERADPGKKKGTGRRRSKKLWVKR